MTATKKTAPSVIVANAVRRQSLSVSSEVEERNRVSSQHISRNLRETDTALAMAPRFESTISTTS